MLVKPHRYTNQRINMTGKIVISIPYSGTRFLRRRLEIPESAHVYTPWKRLMELIEGKKILAPIRNPADNWNSWARRWPKDQPIEKQVGTFVRCWYTMHALTLIRDIEWYPIDIPELRNESIKDWSPVGHDDPGDNKHPFETDFIYDLPFVKQFYKYGEKYATV